MAACRLQLHLSARDLKNLAGLIGISDPFAIVTIRGDNPENAPRIAGQTDVVFNNLNPSWSRCIFIDDYRFGVPCYIEVGVFDFDASRTGKTELELSRMDANSQALLTTDAASRELLRDGRYPHKVMGTALFEIGQILGSRGNVGSKSLQNGGAVYVHIERSSNQNTGRCLLQLRARGLANVQSLGRTSSPFYEIYRKIDRPTGATWIAVYRSNVVKADLNPLWTAASLDLESICNGDLDRALKIVCWDHRKTGKHKSMGECETTMRHLLETRTSTEAALDYGLTLYKHDREAGTIHVVEASLSSPLSLNGTPAPLPAPVPVPVPDVEQYIRSIRRPSGGGTADKHSLPRPEFVDYLSGGCQISLAVAIDFTASNGDPRLAGTPHYFHPPDSKEWNDYEKAIFAVGSILAKYDSNQQFPVWGFGAKYNNVVRHCFQCGTEVEVDGVQGIMDAYRGVFRTPLTMSYPTRFTEVIQTAASYARHEQEVAEEDGKQSYTILLILTAGNVENIQETKQALIEASDDPLSVVIVGIGDADFESMEFLDEHDPAREAGRDITKFVRFNDYKSFNALTEAVLDEIPDQLVSYFFDRGILPGQLEDFNEDDVDIAPADDDERTFSFLG